jgi:predicted nucleic acid-binding Zn ribbon protein
MKRNQPTLVGDIIARAIDQSGSREVFDRQRVCYLWPEVVGPTINRLTTRRWVDRDELHVVIASAALKNELSFMNSRLTELINQAFGAQIISKIVIH